MPSSARPSRRTAVRATAAALGVGTACALAVPLAGPAQAWPSTSLRSAVTGVSSTSQELVLAGASWTRTTGVLTGVVDPRERVAGLDALPKDADGRYVWTSQFELIAPTGATREDLVLVEAENRGSPLVLTALHDLPLLAAPTTPTGVTYPAGLGNAFLAQQGVSYARVQWETGISAGVPATAQGVGEVIVRDLGRLLEGRTPRPAGAPALPRYDGSVLAGVSQSAWFVNTLVAEGFNVDPRSGRRVFDAAVAVSGAGNWLAINQLAGAAAQRPYVLPDGVPLRLDQLLTRPQTDPTFVDVANYTDFYRVRASVAAQGDLPWRRARRYDWPSPHAGAAYPDATVFGALRCNGGVVVPRNPINYRPYLRTVVEDLTRVVEQPGTAVRGALPPSRRFRTTAAPEGSASFNDLPGVALQVPQVDPDTAQPLGGVRFPEAVLPLGRPLPVALTPVGTTSIVDLCGNWGGWQPFSAAELATRYGSVDQYVARYARAVDRQVRAGYLRAEERQGMLDAARTSFLAAPQT